MYAYQRTTILSAWIEPSSPSEQDRQDRAQRMVQAAINQHPPFRNVGIAVYPKGSYANNTNVRLDSDVDIVVQCQDCLYYDRAPGAMLYQPSGGAYCGVWTPDLWRNEVVTALTNYFGASEVDSKGAVAINIRERPGSRPSADVVPSFDYRLYTDSFGRHHAGSTVFKKDGTQIVNWPAQQLANGTDKNNRTSYRYKRFVRALKNAENLLCKEHVISLKPSYLMECLVFNVGDYTLTGGTLVDDFEATLAELDQGLRGFAHCNWLEPNGLKSLFGSEQKWTTEDAREVVFNTWKWLYQ